ncbi:DUF3866 family protein [Ammoniphilus sp. CFH 90114]|uniref:DUF3866 family protein n=1 Tax=Ammoniphilus sp. CFH 90114 TaxID=2493665 RepID=UPI00100FC2FB|nr:DUF3866 family protein [Ammoniphilus sp. CFH 90114]RXT13822.1 DUF3866 family protein [Ammoniphilus sp. CFH 90114]
MIQTAHGIVTDIIRSKDEIQEVYVDINGKREKAINYPLITGVSAIGHRVVVNTTAVALGLGTGGYHFIMHNLDSEINSSIKVSHHIMKLRYTPHQLATGSCEEQGSPYHEKFLQHQSIEGMPVLVGGLHSMLPIVVTYIKKIDPSLRIAYIMTDKASLPMAFSKHVERLNENGWLDGTITIGHSFGGDLEAVNIYTGLLAAKHILRADITLVLMGPGIVGTGTPLGFSGMEQVEILHATHTLKGLPVSIPRVGEADLRKRHQGISHHTLTVLQHTLAPVYVPILEDVASKSDTSASLHRWIRGNREKIHRLEACLSQYPYAITTMGRSFQDDPLFYESVGLAADFAMFIQRAEASVLSDSEALGVLWKASTIP